MNFHKARAILESAEIDIVECQFRVEELTFDIKVGLLFDNMPEIRNRQESVMFVNILDLPHMTWNYMIQAEKKDDTYSFLKDCWNGNYSVVEQVKLHIKHTINCGLDQDFNEIY